MGAVEVKYEEVTEVPRSGRGKFRAVVCNLSDDDRRRAENTSARTTSSV
jgi:hypothetical protein